MPSEEKLSTDEKVRRSVSRLIANGFLLIVLLAGLIGWASFGAFTLQPGQAAVLLRFGQHVGTISTGGFHLTLPPPFVVREIANVAEVESEDFGFRGKENADTSREKINQATMQTSDNNIVRLNFAVQYRIKDAFAARFRVKDPVDTLREAAEAAMRQVVGKMTVDGVLSEQRGEVKLEAAQILQDILDSYDAGLEIQDVQLQEVQPPREVRAAFDDVIAANQDASRVVNEAQGYQNEILPNARAEAAELVQAASGYRDAHVAEATGEAERFKAIVAEYRKAPEVTRTRLYLETMEAILPDVEKVIIEEGAANLVPYLPIGRSQTGRPQVGAQRRSEPRSERPAEARDGERAGAAPAAAADGGRP